MGFKGFALEQGQKHKSESYVFSLISCNYKSLKEDFTVRWCMIEEADTFSRYLCTLIV